MSKCPAVARGEDGTAGIGISNVVVSQLMTYSDLSFGITISRRSFVLSQFRVKISASLTNAGGMTVGELIL